MTCEDAVLLDSPDVARLARMVLLVGKCSNPLRKLRVLLRESANQRMLWCQLQARGSEDGIDARGEDLHHIAAAFHRKRDRRTFTAANPVALHGAYALGPVIQLVQPIQQFLRILCRPQEPLLQLALLHQCVFVPPAVAVDHLLVRQHGLALRTPVHLALLAVCQAALVHAQKEPLVPPVVVRQTRRHLGGPVVAQAEAVHLHPHRRDVLLRPLARRRVVLERGVLRRQAEGIPAHRMQHVVALHPHVARQRIADRIVAHVAHVQLSGGIGQHLEHVILRLPARRRLGCVQLRLRGPPRLPARFNLRRVVTDLGAHLCVRRRWTAAGVNIRARVRAGRLSLGCHVY